MMLITIDPSGVVEAYLSLKTFDGLNEVRLPAEPIPETIEVRVGGEYAVAIYEDGMLYFFSPVGEEAEITYLVNISARNGIFSFSISEGNLTRLRVSPQIILLTVPKNIEGMEYVEGDLVIEFYGPEEIEYAVRTGVTTTASIEIFTTETQMTGTRTFEPPGSSGVRLMDHAIMMGVIALLAGAISAAVIYSRSKRRGVLAEAQGLTKLDRMILEAIENAGGSILQGELQAALGLPKTTLWRHVKKLGKLGYIQIVKEGALNRLILLRKPVKEFRPNS